MTNDELKELRGDEYHPIGQPQPQKQRVDDEPVVLDPKLTPAWEARDLAAKQIKE